MPEADLSTAQMLTNIQIQMLSFVETTINNNVCMSMHATFTHGLATWEPLGAVCVLVQQQQSPMATALQ